MTNKKHTIKIREFDDWVKVWIDGSLHTSDHSIPIEELGQTICDLAGYEFDYEYTEGYDE